MIFLEKTIRERAEETERSFLCRRAAFATDSRGIERQEEECPVRTCYQRDRDRILHSSAFRRLKHKTQVFLAPQNDYYRTRLTHTLEVAQIARTIARALRLNEDLTEAAALGHDLGHTPFGHAGEKALRNFSDINFRHNEQSVRVVEKLEKNGRGLNLTYEVKNAVLCHSGKEKASTLEGRILRYADKIAYINHDIDDAVAAGIMSESDIPADIRERLGGRKKERINTLVLNVIENSGSDIKMSADCEEAFLRLRSFMFQNIYESGVCREEDEKAYYIVERLYGYYLKNISRMPSAYINIAEKEGSQRAVCDYIAGMSDTYALKEYNDLFIPRFAEF